MDPIPIVDVRSGIDSIVREFSDALDLFQRWRKSRAGRKGVGQEECETSLEDGKTKIEGKFNKCLNLHGRRFDRGDNICRDRLRDHRAKFHTDILEVLARAVAGKLSKAEKIDPLELMKAIESTRKATIAAMDELSERIANGTSAPSTWTDPGDVLPPMPLPPMRVPQAPGTNSIPGQVPITSSLFNRGDGSSNPMLLPHQTYQPSPPGPPLPGSAYLDSFGRPIAPIPQRPYIQPPSQWTVPDFGNSQAMTSVRPSTWTLLDFSNSQALTKIGPSTSAMANAAMSWAKDMFPPKPVRQYYDDIAPSKPTPAVVPTFVCNVEPEDILKDMERAVQELRAAAEYDQNQRLREHTHSAPPHQDTLKKILFGDDEDDDDDRTNPSYFLHSEETPVPDDYASQTYLKPGLQVARPSSAQAQRRIRSQPNFSKVVPKIRRNASNPETHIR
ncbi:hypothetical protein VTL71DRAFT_11564 [Oculimacula yallundae]|uniref:Uncharacterized protein n=1 Tax=Oculimacula yallundae TaxID=86028 RepID=A0ABR4CQI9_9HELO